MKYLTLSFILFATAVFAQENQAESEPKILYVQQACDDPVPLAEVVQSYEEEPLFIGTGVQTHASGQQFTGSVMFFVNQASGTWSIITLFDEGRTACMTLSGYGFQPFTQGMQTKQ